MSTIDLVTENFRLSLMKPEMVTDRWVEWTNDRVIMRQINSKPKKLSKSDIQNYVLDATLKRRAIVGIFRRVDQEHVGLYEILFDQAHRNVNFDILIDFKRFSLPAVIDETLTALMNDVKLRFGAEKAVILAPESYSELILYLERSDWHREGILRSEFPNANGAKRLDGLHFGKIL